MTGAKSNQSSAPLSPGIVLLHSSHSMARLSFNLVDRSHYQQDPHLLPIARARKMKEAQPVALAPLEKKGDFSAFAPLD